MRDLTLTDCDTHDNWPPEAFQPFLGDSGRRLRGALDAMLADKDFYRSAQALVRRLRAHRAFAGAVVAHQSHPA